MALDESVDVTRLIHEARRGDARAREDLFGLCRSYLGFVARAQLESAVRAKVDASDVVQQTMLEAHRDFLRFQGDSEGEWLAWLRRILTHNVGDCLRHYRGTAKRQAAREVPIRHGEDTAGVGEPAARDESPSRQLARFDEELRVAAALERLAPDYQEVIVLRNLQRLPFNQVAERMGRSRPAVQMLWMRAIKRLQEELGPDGG